MESIVVLVILVLLTPFVLSIVALVKTSRLKRQVVELELALSRVHAGGPQTQPGADPDTKEASRTDEDATFATVPDAQDEPADDLPPEGAPDRPQASPPGKEPETRTQSKPPTKTGFEERFGARWSVWTGGIALALGGIFLVRYSIEQGLVTPSVRVMLGALLALVLSGLGEWSRRSDLKSPIPGLANAHIPGVLTAAGIVTAFATIYVAYAFYGFLGPAAAFVLLGIVSVASLAGSSLHGPYLAALGLAGSYVTPLLVSSDKPAAWPLFIYLAFVTAATYATARLRHWTWLATASSACAAGWGLVWFSTAWTDADGPVIALYCIALMALSYLVFGKPGSGHAAEKEASGLVPVDLPVLTGQFAAGVLAYAYLRTAHYDALSCSVFALILVAALVATWRWSRLVHLLPMSAGLFLFAYLTWHIPAILDYTELDWVQGEIGLLPVTPPEIRTFLVFGIVMAAIYGLAGFAGALMKPGLSAWATVSSAVPTIVFAYAYYRATDFEHSIPFGIAGVVLAGLAILAAERCDRTDNSARDINVACFAVAAVAVLAFAFTILLDKGWLTVALALMTPGLVWIAQRRHVGVLRYLAVGLALVVVARLVYDPHVMAGDAGSWPVFNWLLFGYGVPAVAFAAAAWQMRGAPPVWMSQLLEGAAIVFSVVLVSLEIRHWIHDGQLLSTSFGLVELSLNTIAWLALSMAYQRIHLGTARTAPKHAASILGVLAFLSILVGHLVLYNPMLVNTDVGDGLVFNDVLLGYGLPAIMCALVYWTGRTTRPRYFLHAAGIASLVMLFAYVSLEVRVMFHGARPALGATTDLESYTYSAVWLVMGLTLLLAGIFFGRVSLRYASLPIIVLTVAKVFLFDMANLTGILRAVSFIGLGLVLVGIGYLYQKVIFPRSAEDSDPGDSAEQEAT